MARMVQLLLTAVALVHSQAYVMPSGTSPRAASTSDASVSHVQQPLFEEIAAQPQASAWNPLAFGMALGLFAAVVGARAPAALAADLDNGESTFAANCASCHAGGNNSVAPEKKLKKEALQQYGKYEVAQIVTQVTKGNGAMPAFGERLSPEDIGDVAAYVRAQADKGW